MKLSKAKIEEKIKELEARLFVPPKGRGKISGENELWQKLDILKLLLELDIDNEDYKGGVCSKCGAWKGGDYGINGNGKRSYHTCKPRVKEVVKDL